jgi:hypothetical protein
MEKTTPATESPITSHQAPNLGERFEIASNVVALFKLPMPIAELAGIVEHFEVIYGRELRMTEQPKGWLQFLKY